MEPRWLSWAQRLQAIAQTGLTYAPNQYDVERYEEVREIAAEMMAEGSHGEGGRARRLLSNSVGHPRLRKCSKSRAEVNRFESTPGSILLESIACSGTNQSLQRTGTSDFGHSERAGV